LYGAFELFTFKVPAICLYNGEGINDCPLPKLPGRFSITVSTIFSKLDDLSALAAPTKIVISLGVLIVSSVYSFAPSVSNLCVIILARKTDFPSPRVPNRQKFLASFSYKKAPIGFGCVSFKYS
jgi:hypothetical protein